MRILVGMSGGVDSSCVAMKLIEQGHEVEGVYLVMHEYSDAAAAVSAAEKLGIPLSVVDCRDEFSAVRENFVSEYIQGRTPNPCVVCNPLVKFAALVRVARERGFDRIATGHYARVMKVNDGSRIRHAVAMAADEQKDQSYMLYRLSEEVLSMLLLPLGGDSKSEVREYINSKELRELDRPDSQEICFIPDGGYAEYIEERAGKCPRGSFINSQGEPIGEHKGIIRYTVGQRKGLGISLGERVFVTDIDSDNNTVTLEPHPRESSELLVDGVHLALPSAVPSGGEELLVKIRYAARPTSAVVIPEQDGRMRVLFKTPQRSVTPGQSAVFYKDGVVVGGGFICK